MRHSSPNTDDLAGTLIAYGLDVRSVEADGAIHRVNDNQHAKRRNGHGWYRADIDRETGVLFAAYGSWSRGDGVGETHTWTDRGRGQAVTVDRGRVERTRAAKAAERAAKTANAAKAAEGLLDAATAATEHPYLTAKGIQANGALVDHAGRLLLPIRDLAGGLLGLQAIATDGDKRFLKGTDRTTPGCFIIGDPAGAAIVAVVEGFATGASVHEATRWPVLVAFDAGGLTKIAAPLRAMLPDAVMVFAGDNDASEVGQTAARKAAEAAGGVDTVPPAVATDWNDHAALHGLERVRVLLAEAAKATPRTPRDAKGRFTGVGAFEVLAEPREPLPTADEAQAATRTAVTDWTEAATGWFASAKVYGPPPPLPVVLIASSPGVGKSTATREIIDVEALGWPGDVVYHAPTHRLAEEAARDTQGHVTRGRTAESCKRFDMVEDVVRSGLPVTSTLCSRVTRDKHTGQPNGPPQLCPEYEWCTTQGHFSQWSDLPKEPQLRYRASAYLVAHGDGSERPEAARIIDETTWGQHVRVRDVPLDIWTRPRATLDFVDLVDAAKALVSALETGDLTAFVKGYSQHDFREFEEAEAPPTWLERYPSSADHNLAAALKIRNTNYPMAGRRAQVWRILAEAKAAGLATSERLRIVRGVRAPGTGEPRDVLRLTWLREPDRTRPTLLLDADASPLISERLWPGSKIVKAQAEPNAHVTQITDKTLSKDALQSPRVREEAASLVRYQSWLDRLNGGSGVLVGATRSVVAAMFKDACHDIDGMTAKAASAFMQATPLHGARWIWFGSAALGRNDWSDCTTVIILGREELPTDALEDLGRALFGDSSQPLEFMDPDARNMPEVEARYTMRDGSGRAVLVRQHPDPRIAEIQTQVRECATRQLIERLRLVRAAKPKRVVIACKIPLPDFPVDELTTWADLIPNRLECAALEAAEDGRQVLRLSSAGLAADAPETFPNAKAAKNWLAVGGRAVVTAAIVKGTATPNIILLPVAVPLTASVRFKRAGASGSATQALTWSADPQAIVEAAFGPLASFEIDGNGDGPKLVEAEVQADDPEMTPDQLASDLYEERAAPVPVLSFPLETDFEEQAALIEYGAGVPREWAEGYARLLRLPCPTGITPERWKQIIDDGGYFIDRWAVMAAQLGWTTRVVFGISPKAPEHRLDMSGLVPLLTGQKVLALTAEAACIDAGRQTSLRIFPRIDDGAVPIWEMNSNCGPIPASPFSA